MGGEVAAIPFAGETGALPRNRSRRARKTRRFLYTPPQRVRTESRLSRRNIFSRSKLNEKTVVFGGARRRQRRDTVKRIRTKSIHQVFTADFTILNRSFFLGFVVKNKNHVLFSEQKHSDASTSNVREQFFVDIDILLTVSILRYVDEQDADVSPDLKSQYSQHFIILII